MVNLGYKDKYYFYKLKHDFFDNEEIKVLESMEGGYKYSNIFLKLLCRGNYYERGKRFLEVNEKVTNIVDFISIITGFDPFTVGKALGKLIDLNLINIKDNLIIINDLNIDPERDRTTKKYKDWRNDVFERDNYTCQKCGEKGGELNAHHIKSWANYKEKRFDLDNGLTLCVECHKKVHRKD